MKTHNSQLTTHNSSLTTHNSSLINMAKQKLNTFSALVYSTNPNQQLDSDIIPEPDTIEKTKQKLRIRLETKHRGGKAVTVITGFIGTQKDLEELSKKLKANCGTGGSAKDAEILIQGDNREKVKAFLLKDGYKDIK
jgi:translation initiation factor 1